MAEEATDDVHGLLSGGKIIEEIGSNPNGEYVRFADGTQICHRTIEHDFTSTAIQEYSYSANFLANEKISGSISFISTTNVGHNEAFANTLVSCHQGGLHWTAATVKVASSNPIAGTSVLAIGRWK